VGLALRLAPADAAAALDAGAVDAGALDAAALDAAAGSPRHHILRGLYGALILSAGKDHRRRETLKEKTCRTAS
jgi:hypothetical protein